MAANGSSPESLIPKFQFERLLNQDQGGRRIVLKGTIDDKDAILLVERAAFATEDSQLQAFLSSIDDVRNLGDNDIYRWYMASTAAVGNPDSTEAIPDLKLNLIFPCKESHIRKYSFQQARVVTETPEIYQTYTRPYMAKCREEGRLNWVFNIMEGRTEQENVLFRSKEVDRLDDYLLLPDLNWDRTTIGGLHLLALVERRDIWSVRDLKKKDAAWLRHFRQTLAKQTEKLYPAVESDMLKFYVHCRALVFQNPISKYNLWLMILVDQPTYYHFHVHIVHINLDASGTQAVGKALSLDNVISQLETMGDTEGSMADVELTYTVGEASELWTEIYLPLKEGRKPSSSE